MKTPYTLSTDYAELFELIQDGTAIAGICEYKENQDSPALIFKKDGYWIDSKNPAGFHENSSQAHFAMMCEHYKVRWIVPADLPQSCQTCGEKVTMISAGAICPICKEEQ